jgi:non-canonical (house-cleaning) NTP pyrophosphatase
VVALHGFLQERESVSIADRDALWDGLVLEVPLGDRATERAALDRAVTAFTGSEDDFTWAVPAGCLPRVTLAPQP